MSVLSYVPTSLGQSAIAPRINAPVNETSLITLHGNVPAAARAEFDQGEAPSATQMSHVRIVLSRSDEQEAALDKYMADLQDKSSPNYQKWLTPDQFGKLYGPADSDIAAIVAWLESHGLKVEEVSSGRTNIAFSGTVRQIEEALHTSIHSYQANGEQFLSNNSNPVIPAALAPVIAGVARLNTIRPRPHHVTASLGNYDTESRRFVSSKAGLTSAPRPALTGGAGTTSNPYTLYMVAGDAATIYDTPNSFNANFSSGTSYTGSGVRIGIGGDAVINPTTVANYWTAFLGQSQTSAAARLTITNVDGVTSTTDADEAYLDAQASGGLAPGASIHFYTASTVQVAIQQMLNDNAVDIFSLSFGLCENFLTTSDNQMINGWWQQAAAQGIAVTVSSGDSGSAGCDNNNVATAADYGLSVSGYASTPYNIAVGGTDFSVLLTSFTNYVGTSNSNSNFFRTAMKYIPESTWNDSVVTNGTVSANVPFVDSNNLTNIVAGSGGASSCATNSDTRAAIGVCTGGYPKPAWQRGSGVPPDGVRDLPDISLMSGAGGDNAAWLVCTDETQKNSSGVSVTADCSKQSDGNFYFFGIGGTSAAAPAFAGILALVQQKAGGRLGQAAQGLYDLYNGANASAIYHDITVGNISVPCDSGTPDCTQNAAGKNFLTGYDTTSGYDLATGIGSVDATQLINFWGSATPARKPTVTVTPSASSIPNSTGVHVAVAVAGSTGTPTGSVVLISPPYMSVPQALAAGATTFSVPAGTLKVGVNTLTVNYGGDTNYASASGSTTVTVTGLTPTISVNPSTTSLKASDSMTVQTTVSGTGATPTGTVTLYGASYFAAGQPLSNGSYTFNIPANSLYGGNNQSLTVSYSGDGNYSANTGTTSISVTPVYALSATAPSAVTAGAVASSTVTVSSSSGYAGTVSLSCALTSSPSGATGLPTCNSANSAVLLTSSTTSGTATVSLGTTTRAALERPRMFPWEGAGGGAVLALVIFLGIPAHRRRWLSMLGMLAMMMTLGSMLACGGGGGGSGGGGGGGTTAGTYTFTVTGTGNPSLTPPPTTTITLTVN